LAYHSRKGVTQDFASVEKELKNASEKLFSQFHSVSAQVRPLLSSEEMTVWAREGLTLARYAPDSSAEAAEAYFRVTFDVLACLSFPRFLDWTHCGETLCQHSPGLAVAYFQVSPELLAVLPYKLFRVWLEIGKSLYRGNPESMALTSSFFSLTPALLRSTSLVKVERLAILLNRLAATSHHLAAECLGVAPAVLASVGKDEQGAFLALALALVRRNAEESARYFRHGADALARIDRGQQAAFLFLTDRLAKDSVRHALAFFFDCSQALGNLDPALHSRLLKWAETLLKMSAVAGIGFLKSCPALLAELGTSGLERWFKEGVRVLEQDQPAGLAFFQPGSVSGKALKRLATKVDLEQVHRVLLMYCRALAGTKVQIQASEGLPGRDGGWVQTEVPATDGTTIFVPLSVGRYNSEEENFAWYKVAVTHQAGHIEFGSFDFSFEREARLFTNYRKKLASANGGLTDMGRFFSLFEDRKLIVDIFTVVEDTRVDYLLKQAYAGIRNSYQNIQQESLSRRIPFSVLSLREACLELLIRLSLGDEPGGIPFSLRGKFKSAARVLRRVQCPAATVEDSAEAALRLYQIISTVPDTHLSTSERGTPDLTENEFSDLDNLTAQQDGHDAVSESGGELSRRAAAEVDFRGNFNPELVQLLMKLKEDPRQLGLDSVSLSAETLKELAGREIDLGGILRGHLSHSSGLYVADLPAEIQAQRIPTAEQDVAGSRPLPAELAGSLEEGNGDCFLYDEWDFQACRYLPGWCRVREKPLAEGDADFFEKTLARHSLLASQIRKQFEMLAPERIRKCSRLYDGEEIDLNAVIQSVVERKAGSTPSEKIYWKRRKIQRDVAVAFLLDMSSSTANVIKDTDGEEDYFDWYFDAIEALSRWPLQRAREPAKATPRRVIDVIKESVVLMINALEATGDCYGVFGFSGHGRENVELLVVKGMDEKFSETVERRIDRIVPLRSTRMGPAVRHVSSKLAACEASTRILFLVSDGYPQDKDYGRDSSDKEYALHDTRMALIEARRKNIAPFCLTIDVAGHDYLSEMSQDIGYEVVNDIELLPVRLPLLYRRLTS